MSPAKGHRKETARRERLRVRVTAAEEGRYQAAATKAGLSLSRWVRTTLEAEATMTRFEELERQAKRYASTIASLEAEIEHRRGLHMHLVGMCRATARGEATMQEDGDEVVFKPKSP